MTDVAVSRPPWPERMRGWFTVALTVALAAVLEVSYRLMPREPGATER